ncbi:hypothetical protein MC885_014050 [Smutsia gigantea]|nr:hypothetical protein MC885_014050 [Smutsia gigantea]
MKAAGHVLPLHVCPSMRDPALSPWRLRWLLQLPALSQSFRKRLRAGIMKVKGWKPAGGMATEES